MDKKLADLLFTARWAVNANKSQYAYEQITEALVSIGALPGEDLPDLERDGVPMPKDFVKNYTEPKFVVVKGVKYKDHGSYKTPSGMFSGLVVHYTASGRTPNSAVGNVKYLASKGLGCMVMDENGTIYTPEDFDLLRDWGSHAGVSKWNGISGVSNIFAGMEICCWGRGSKIGPFRESKGEANIIEGKYQTFTLEQEDALINFCLWAKDRNPEFKIENIVGHDEIRSEAGLKGDKTDPGASLSVSMEGFRDVVRKMLSMLDE